MTNRWGRQFWDVGLLVSFKLKYVIGGLYFGNSRRLTAIMVFLPFRMNTIKKMLVWTHLSQYNVIIFVPIYRNLWSCYTYCIFESLINMTPSLALRTPVPVASLFSNNLHWLHHPLFCAWQYSSSHCASLSHWLPL